MRCRNGIDVILLIHGRDPTVSKPMTKQINDDQLATQNPDLLAEKIANIDLDKEPANAHEERLQNLKRFFLEADWLDDN